MKLSKSGLLMVALTMSLSVEAKGLFDVLIDTAVDTISKAVNQNGTQVHSGTSGDTAQGLPNGYVYASSNDAGEVGSTNPEGVKITTDLNGDGTTDTVALLVTSAQDVLFLYSNISGSESKVEPIFNEDGEDLTMYDFALQDRSNGQIKISTVYKMGVETNVLATYDKALNDFKINNYIAKYEIECAQPTVVSLDFANGLYKEKQTNANVSCTQNAGSKMKKEHKTIQASSMFLSDGINAVTEYVNSISPN